jgi:glycosyltransferase involved in cell wall biosynthesis
MPGFTTDTNPFYYHSNLFVLSSNFEGLPTVLIEALDYGISIVSTDCPSGPSEILSNGIYGTLVPVGDAEKLAFAMQQSLLNPRDKISLKGRAKDFSVEKMSELYLSMFLNF